MSVLGNVVEYPEYYNPSVLTPISRYVNRSQYGINKETCPFNGLDIWNCYEISFLLDNGFPLNFVGRLSYPVSTLSIVESKSLKLYLYSFNMHKCGANKEEAKRNFINIVQDDLNQVLQTNQVKLELFDLEKNTQLSKSLLTGRSDWDSTFEFEEIKDYKENTELIEIVKLLRDDQTSTFSWYSSLLRSRCKVTNQPDWGTLLLDLKILDKSIYFNPSQFLMYIISLRDENHFHEEIVEIVYFRLWQKLLSLDIPEDSIQLAVSAVYTRRGGIDIFPIRTNSCDLAKYRYHLVSKLIDNEIVISTDSTVRYEKLDRQ